MRWIGKNALWIIGYVSLAACSGAHTLGHNSNRHAVEASDFSRSVKLIGANIVVVATVNDSRTRAITLRLRGAIDKQDLNDQSHVLHLSVHYVSETGWHLYDRATFLGVDGDEAVELTSIWRSANACRHSRCSLTESLIVTVPGDQLLLGEPIDVALRSKSGDETRFSLPKSYVRAYAELLSQTVTAQLASRAYRPTSPESAVQSQ